MSCRRVWIAVVIVAACAAPTRSVAPVAGKTVVLGVEPAGARARPAIAGFERVRFDPDSVAVSPAATAVLDTVVQRLTAEPALDLQISGHTDPAERDADNTGTGGLSDARANVVRRYLVGRGIAGHRLVIRAVGTAEPRDASATDANGAANRRVEFEKVTIKVDPFSGRTVVTSTDVEILDKVSFEPGKAVIEATSWPILDAVAATLVGNPSILLVEVQSHTDERGDPSANLRLSEARALAVVKYLIGKGVGPARLVAQGYGRTQPLDARHTEAAWAKNERIAFLILKRAP